MTISSQVQSPQTTQTQAEAQRQIDVCQHVNIGDELDVELPYSTFSPLEKSFLAYAASVSATFSGLSSFIYYPAITALAQTLHTSTEAINLTITAYLITSCIAPSFLGDLADRMGRRPVTILALALYFGANLGLAIQDNYVALMVLRCVQSAGASSTIALAYGIIADVSAPSERGSYMAILMGFTNAAPSLGPVVGGVLTQELSWHWIFWLLSILSGVHVVGLFIFLPETSRKLVGDGSICPAHPMSRSLYSLISRPWPLPPPEGQIAATFSLPNPFSCLVALFERSNFIILVVGGLQYTVFGCLAASLSSQMIKIHSFNYLTAGLVYLPSGAGGVIASYSTGRLLDHDYRVTARKYGLPISKSSNDITRFPIEQARLRSVFPFFVLNTIASAGYGWSLHSKTHVAAPLMMQFITGGTSVTIFSVCGSLLTDLNAGRSATVQASYNLVRCAMGAAGVGALQAAIDGVGVGWCFTIYGLLGSIGLPLFLALRRHGEQWRNIGDSIGRESEQSETLKHINEKSSNDRSS